jgi:hypothetical protein
VLPYSFTALEDLLATVADRMEHREPCSPVSLDTHYVIIQEQDAKELIDRGAIPI